MSEINSNNLIGSLPPGNLGLPLLGESFNFLAERNFFQKRNKKYGHIFKTHLLGRPTVVMTGTSANRFILSTNSDHFSWREGWPKTFKELFGNSLFLQEGEEHRRNRKLLMPAFCGNSLINYIATMEDIMQSYFERWEKQERLAWVDELKQMTFDIASVLLLGSESGAMTRKLSQEFTKFSQGLFTLPVNIPGTPYNRAIGARDKILRHVEIVIEKRQKNPQNDALGLLVQTQDTEGNRLSLEEIRVQALLMLFSGHETTTSMLSSFCLALGQHPSILQKAREEQYSLGITGRLNIEQLRNMPYLERIFKEVERLYPSVIGGFRGVIKAFTFDGYYVPAGWQLLYLTEGAHKDPTIYTNVEMFDPDRFSPERAENSKVDYSLVGFGGGSRICLGMAFAQMEMKIFASYLLRYYNWEILPNQDLSLKPIPTLHPRSGLKVKFFKKDGSGRERKNAKNVN